MSMWMRIYVMEMITNAGVLKIFSAKIIFRYIFAVSQELTVVNHTIYLNHNSGSQFGLIVSVGCFDVKKKWSWNDHWRWEQLKRKHLSMLPRTRTVRLPLHPYTKKQSIHERPRWMSAAGMTWEKEEKKKKSSRANKKKK